MKKLALLITDSGDREYRHINCRLVNLEGDKITNPYHDYQDKRNEYYNDLQITCQIDNHTEHPYAWRMEYHNVYSLELYVAELSFKTLKRIESALAKLDQKFGRPSTYPDYVIRLANILKVEAFIFPSNDKNKSWNYAGNEYRFEYNFDYAKSSIAALVQRHMEELRQIAA